MECGWSVVFEGRVFESFDGRLLVLVGKSWVLEEEFGYRRVVYGGWF